MRLRQHAEGPVEIFLRCYAEGRQGKWEAICLDLDIAVQGKSFDEVQEALLDSIILYLERISELPEDEQKRLLYRRAPFSVRLGVYLRYALSLLYSIFRPPSGDGSARADFTVRCPA